MCVHREGAEVGLRQELDRVGVVAEARVQEVAGHAANELRTRRPLQRAQGAWRSACRVPVCQLLPTRSMQQLTNRLLRVVKPAPYLVTTPA